jgi:acyl-CoA thioester hydrolase
MSVFAVEFKVRDYSAICRASSITVCISTTWSTPPRIPAAGIDFAELARQKVNLVVVRSELDYKASLTSGDQFVVTVAFEAVSRVRFGFRQQVIRLADQKVAGGLIIAVNERGRPAIQAFALADRLKPPSGKTPCAAKRCRCGQR